MKKSILVQGVLVMAIGATFTGCDQPTDPTPEPEPLKVVLDGVTFTNVDTLVQTTVYEFDNAIGTYYTSSGNVEVTTVQFTVTIDGNTFVNDYYRDVGRVHNALLAYGDITTKYWLKTIDTEYKFWLVTNAGEIGFSYTDITNTLGGGTWFMDFDFIHAPTDLTGYIE